MNNLHTGLQQLDFPFLYIRQVYITIFYYGSRVTKVDTKSCKTYTVYILSFRLQEKLY